MLRKYIQKNEREIGSFIINDLSSNRSLRRLEVLIWFVLSGFILAPVFMNILAGDGRIPDMIEKGMPRIIAAAFLLLVPILYKLVFNAFPIESTMIFIDRFAHLLTVILYKDRNHESSKSFDELEQQHYEHSSTENLLSHLAINSKNLARVIFSRAGVFLLIGGVIAFSGVAFFYISTTLTSPATDLSGLLIQLAPNFGILFFIEFIALFFLRQYRTAMDEFRYYESLQRSREETLAIVKIMKNNGEKIDVYQLVEKCGFRSGIENLNSGQTTDLIE